MSRSRKLFVWSGLSVAVTIGLVALYAVFEYTLVPDIHESISGSKDMDGVALGSLLFETRGCSGCHSLDSVSSSNIGPDLTAIAVDSSASEIAASIVDPDAEISVNCDGQPCPAGLMPRFGEILDEREIGALVEFLLLYGGGESG